MPAEAAHQKNLRTSTTVSSVTEEQNVPILPSALGSSSPLLPIKKTAVPAKGKRKTIELGVTMRTPMGEYIVEKGHAPLSSLAIPTPGPLTYDPKLPPAGFQHSILGKHVPSRLEENPIGPGPYNVTGNTVVFNDAPHWSFGMKVGEFMKVENENPSPFAYSDATKAFGKEGPRYTMSGWFSSPMDTTPEILPGPQDYDVRFTSLSTIATAPSHTCRPRVGEPVFSSKEAAQFPAANEYNPKLRATEIAASLKGYYKETKALKTPGPANYVIPSSLFAAGPQYSLAARNDFDDADDFPDAPPRVHGPGPTSYDPRPVFDASPKNSLGARWKVFPPKNVTPGPGAYEPKDRQIRGNDGPKATLKGRYEQKSSYSPPRVLGD
ncbi:hypothetical protein HDU84_006437 [Entophlyctis sp. JEL0112]|nr:hypothetical protein HDU84_006437 [Entophlyctis sp. JEL0112]